VQTRQEKTHVESCPEERKAALELFSITVLGLVVAAAFIAALSYDFISARAPIVVMVPLLLLVSIQINRARRLVDIRGISTLLAEAASGRYKNLNVVGGFIGLMVLVLLLIYALGHYIGISVFMLVLLRLMAGESWRLSVALTVCVSLSMYLLFEHGFSIELYRGLLYDMLLRYEG
jgi:hypothetical protein